MCEQLVVHASTYKFHAHFTRYIIIRNEGIARNVPYDTSIVAGDRINKTDTFFFIPKKIPWKLI